ncbi:MAG: hypothetical protein AAF639_14330 [Chloroflexota bacterium]
MSTNQQPEEQQSNQQQQSNQPTDPIDGNDQTAENTSETAANTTSSSFIDVEEVVETAREQASEAIDALRQGEFAQDIHVDAEASSDDRLVALLCYVVPMLLPIIILLGESSKKRPFQRYHAVQSLGLLATIAVLGIAVLVGVTILQIIPFIGFLIAAIVLCFTPIVGFMVVVTFLYYGYQAYQGKRFAIPGLTSFLYDQEWLD